METVTLPFTGDSAKSRVYEGRTKDGAYIKIWMPRHSNLNTEYITIKIEKYDANGKPTPEKGASQPLLFTTISNKKSYKQKCHKKEDESYQTKHEPK